MAGVIDDDLTAWLDAHAAGLFVHTLANLNSIALGFNRENLLLFQLNARQAGHKDQEIASFYSGLQKRFSAIEVAPGVPE